MVHMAHSASPAGVSILLGPECPELLIVDGAEGYGSAWQGPMAGDPRTHRQPKLEGTLLRPHKCLHSAVQAEALNLWGW